MRVAKYGIFLAVVALLLVVQPVAVHAGVAEEFPWEGLQAGMSVDAVRNKIGEATYHPQERPFMSFLVKKNVHLAGIAFDVEYLFDRDGQLSRVSMLEQGGRNKRVQKPEELQRAYEALLQIFIMKYGAPSQERAKKSETCFDARSIWLFGKDADGVQVGAEHCAYFKVRYVFGAFKK